MKIRVASGAPVQVVHLDAKTVVGSEFVEVSEALAKKAKKMTRRGQPLFETSSKQSDDD